MSDHPAFGFCPPWVWEIYLFAFSGFSTYMGRINELVKLFLFNQEVALLTTDGIFTP
jgi:hypothetical protein